MMQLWLLEWINPEDRSTWDCSRGFVIRAKTSQAARKLASSLAGFEGENVWIDPLHSSCVELTPDDDESVIIQDFHYA